MTWIILAVALGFLVLKIVNPLKLSHFRLALVGWWGGVSLVEQLALEWCNHNLMRLPLSTMQQSEVALILWKVSSWALILVTLVFVIIARRQSWRRDARMTGRLAIAGVLAAFYIMVVEEPYANMTPAGATAPKIEAGVHSIQQALDNYGQNHKGHYPEQIQDLVSEKYLTAFPENPFTASPMEQVQIGDPDFAGNFTYAASTVSDEVVGYRLIGYGFEETIGEDVNQDGKPDHVILVLHSLTGVG